MTEQVKYEFVDENQHDQNVTLLQDEDTRYGTSALVVLENCEILSVEEYDGYSGKFRVIAKHQETLEILELKWHYGSCDGCDSWLRDYYGDKDSINKIATEMKRGLVRFNTIQEYYNHRKNEYKNLESTNYYTQNDLVRNVAHYLKTYDDEKLEAQLRWEKTTKSE